MPAKKSRADRIAAIKARDAAKIEELRQPVEIPSRPAEVTTEKKKSEVPADVLVGREKNGRFVSGNQAAKGNYAERMRARLTLFEKTIDSLGGSEAIAHELWKLGHGQYGASPAQRVQALEIILNRVQGKQTEQQIIALIAQESSKLDRPYEAMSAETLERLIRGLPAPAVPASADVVEGEIVTPQASEDTEPAGE